MSFKIGDIQIDNSVVVAPMAGISNSAFRVTVFSFQTTTFILKYLFSTAKLRGRFQPICKWPLKF